MNQKMNRLLDKMPPADIEAEKAVLGSCMLMPEVTDEVILILTKDDFYDDANGLIFEHLTTMWESGRRFDITILADRMRAAKDWEKIGGAAYLAGIMNAVATAAHAKYYAGIVRDKSMLRQLIIVGHESVQAGYDPGGRPASEVIETAEQQMFAVVESSIGATANVTTIQEVLCEAMHRLENRQEGTLAGVPTGYAGIDNLLGGLRPKELTVVGGRPGHGKTSLGLAIAHQAAQRGSTVMVVSLEMSGTELGERMLSSVARCNLYRMRNGMLSTEERQRLVQRSAELGESPLWLDDSPSRSMAQIGAMARRQKRRHGLDLLIIDYLQLVQPENGRDPRQEQVAKMSRRCKVMARELDVAVVILAQVNRTSGDIGRAPRLSELRESGAIEQDADVVLFVHRPAEYDSSKRPDNAHDAEEAEIHVAKHRNGPTGVVKVNWFRDFARFDDRADRDAEESPWEQTWGADDEPFGDPPPQAQRQHPGANTQTTGSRQGPLF